MVTFFSSFSPRITAVLHHLLGYCEQNCNHIEWVPGSFLSASSVARVRGLRKPFAFEVIAKRKAGTFSFRNKNIHLFKINILKSQPSCPFWLF